MANGRLALTFFGNVFRILLRRLREKPRRPTWTFKYEVLVATLRTAFLRAQELGIRGRRDYFDSLALPSSVAGDVTMTKVIAGGVPGMWVAPKRSTPGAPRPVLVYFHGGAYQFGSLKSYEDLLSRLALAAKTRVLAVDYRLAPEFPYPAAIEDAVRVTRWLRENGYEDIAFAGDSAGGNLALAAMLFLRDRGEPLPVCAAPICPWVDLDSEGVIENYAFDSIPRGAPGEWARAYIGFADRADPLISPLRADLNGLPPMLLHVGTAEILHKDVLAFAEKARAAGVEVTLTVYDDMVHDWHLFAGMKVPQSIRAINELGEFLARPRGAAKPKSAAQA